jgi:hypothetical protein
VSARGLDAATTDTDAGGVEPRADTAQMAEIRQQVAALLQKLERAKKGELDEGDADGGGDVSADKPTSADTAPRPDAATTTTTTTTTTGRSSWWSAGKASGVKTRTRQQCHRMLAWGDVCVYENLCTDGLVFYFLDPLGAADVADAKIFYRHQDAVEGAWVLRAVCVCVCVCVCVLHVVTHSVPITTRLNRLRDAVQEGAASSGGRVLSHLCWWR